jgi:hypothetical protein
MAKTLVTPNYKFGSEHQSKPQSRICLKKNHLEQHGLQALSRHEAAHPDLQILAKLEYLTAQLNKSRKSQDEMHKLGVEKENEHMNL